MDYLAQAIITIYQKQTLDYTKKSCLGCMADYLGCNLNSESKYDVRTAIINITTSCCIVLS